MLCICCLQYIQCLRKSGNIEKLRAAREEMNKYYPLTPKMWLEWAKDEISLSTRFVMFSPELFMSCGHVAVCTSDLSENEFHSVVLSVCLGCYVTVRNLFGMLKSSTSVGCKNTWYFVIRIILCLNY